VHAAVEGWREGGAVDFFAQQPASRSVSVTTVAVKPGVVEIDTLREVARERYQVALAGGLGPMTGRAFRIGHLGDCNPAMILGAIGGAEAALRALGVPVGDGVQRAVKALAAE
jgi:alanine-glyoxylate transaminase/serine-glyoxylate transaminase/serine-pyruvate transaminase